MRAAEGLEEWWEGFSYKMALNPSESEDLRVVLLGNSGVGKSATANAILGREAFRETETTECEIQRGRVDSRHISVIDTPGLDTMTLSTDQLKTAIEKCLSLSAPGPHVFLLVIRLRRFTEDQRNTVKWIQKNMGEEALRFSMVLFTGKEELTNRQWTSFSQDVKMTELTDNCGFGYDVINSKREANPAQITKLLEKIDTMIQQNGGQYYTSEMYKAVQRKRRLQEKAQEKKKEEREQEEHQICRQKKKKNGRPKEKCQRAKDEKTPDTKEINTEAELKQSTEDKTHKLLVYTARTRAESTVEHPEPPQGTRYMEMTSQNEVMKTEDERKRKLETRRAQERPVKSLNEREKAIDATSIKENFKQQEEGRRERERRKWEEFKGATGGIVHDPVSDLRLVLLGTAGAGKSTSGNTILGREAFGMDLLNSTPKWMRQDGMVGNKTITVTDTMGVPIWAPFTWDHGQFEECMSMCSPGPHVFLLVIRSPRITWSHGNADLLKENFGEEFVKRCIVLLTHGDMFRSEHRVLLPEFQRLVRSCSGLYHIFNNEEKEDRTQVAELLEKMDTLVKKNGGQHYSNEMYQRAQRRKVEETLVGLEQTLLDTNMRLMTLAMNLEKFQEDLKKNAEEEEEGANRFQGTRRHENQPRQEDEDSSCRLL